MRRNDTPPPVLPDAYVWQIEKVRYHLKLLQDYMTKVSRKKSIEDASWGDFGTLGHVVEDLSDITGFLRIDPDARD